MFSPYTLVAPPCIFDRYIAIQLYSGEILDHSRMRIDPKILDCSINGHKIFKLPHGKKEQCAELSAAFDRIKTYLGNMPNVEIYEPTPTVQFTDFQSAEEITALAYYYTIMYLDLLHCYDHNGYILLPPTVTPL